MDISLLLENEDNPGDGGWEKHWSGLLDGLDKPVAPLRGGVREKIFGPGMPSGWKYLCLWAVSNNSLNDI